MARFVERLLNLRRGDLARGVLLFLYLFFILSSYMVGKVARDALFLDKFNAVKLPYADLAIAGLIGFAVAAYVRIGRKLSLRLLLIGSLVFFAACSLVFWLLAHFYPFEWLFPIVYVWVGIFGVLAPAQVWTLANYVLTTREAKRVFGLIGSGAISGAIFGGFFSRQVSKWYATEDLLLGITAFLLTCAVLVYLIYRQHRPMALVDEDGVEIQDEAQLGVRDSFKMLYSSRYLTSIASVIWISSFVTFFAGWQFRAIAQQTWQSKDELAVFFGTFNFYAGLLALATQLLLTSRVLRRFGLGPALFVVPVTILTGTVGLLLWPTILMVTLLKGGEQVMRYSIDKSAVELLYLPVSSNIKIQIKSFIDTFIWRLGDGTAAIAVLVFATWLGWTPRMVSWVNVVMVSLWLTFAWLARRQYVATLRDSIVQHRLDAERHEEVPIFDRSASEIFSEDLCEVDPQEILYRLSVLELEQNRRSHPVLRDLLEHPDAQVRRKAIALLDSGGDRSAQPRIEPLLKDPDLGVRTEALLFLAHQAHIDPLVRIEELGDFPDFSIRAAMVSFLARPGRSQNLEGAARILDTMVREPGPENRRTRLEAACLIPLLPGGFEKQLQRLIGDDDLEVAREAIRSAGKVGKRNLVPFVIERLADEDLADTATEALAQFGDRIVGTLRDYLTDADIVLEVRRQIPQVLTAIGSEGAQLVLMENLLESDTNLRFRIIAALNKMLKAHPELKPDREMIETVLAAEIMGHYRSYQILGTLGGTLDPTDPVARALQESMAQEKERVFRLMGLLYPDLDLESAYVGVQSTDPLVHANALEFLDNILKKRLREMLVPLLDSDVSVNERVRLANAVVGARVENREEAIAALVYSNDTWLKSCGAYAIGALKIHSLEGALDECLEHPDPLLREAARKAKQRLSSGVRPAVVVK